MKEEIFLEVSELLKSIKQEKPKKANAIVWLQGDRYDRGMKVLNLFKKGWAKRVIISGNNQLIGPDKRPGENNITLTEMVSWLRKRGINPNQIIIDDRSFNTKDQAENVLSLAKEKRLKKIILVASLYHQPRAFLNFLRRNKEVRWSGELINQPAKLNLSKKPSGQNKKGLDLISEEIKKIKRDKFHISDFKEALVYLSND